ncbi:MAG: hypothetical protein A2104_00640 [Candidatus Melainabacteria bacterium GWF2_32_7]|nr:MAG: hypothetical protein A2104_00640 [Candidatus Melainabacteria bacterium GWF2_32_7]
MPKGAAYRFKENKEDNTPDSITIPALVSLIPKELNIKAEIFDETIEKFNKESINADIVVISAMTSTIHRAYTYADYFRSKGIPVVIGGVHATFNPDEVSEHADSVICGIAVHTFPQLLMDFKADKMQKIYKQGEIDFKNTPFPDRNAYAEKNIKPEEIHGIQATYGCKNVCEFCVQPYVCNGCHQRPVEDVLEEIKQTQSEFLEFYDPNLFQNQEYAYKLCEAMIPLNKKWGAPTSINILNNTELLQVASKSGLIAVLVGFESVNQKSLLKINKGFNRVNHFVEAVQKFQNHDIAVFGSFVLGLDEDDENIFQQTYDFLEEVPINMPRFTINTPFPGTEFYRKMKADGRIIEDNWGMYDCSHVVIQPANMHPEDLQQGFYELCNAVYEDKSDEDLHHYYKELPNYTRDVVVDCSDI